VPKQRHAVVAGRAERVHHLGRRLHDPRPVVQDALHELVAGVLERLRVADRLAEHALVVGLHLVGVLDEGGEEHLVDGARQVTRLDAAAPLGPVRSHQLEIGGSGKVSWL
jgi:hypothetical protein